ncbi:MAG: 4-(cytidine 5'-diphospho)-2-C-methyl-D-erythritol kinase [Candidatus Omnitrophota bacterium]
MNTIQLRAHAKINLYLDILGIQKDGYHQLDMVNAKLSLHDLITCTLIPQRTIELTCNHSSIPTDSRNTAFQAASRFLEQTRTKSGVCIHIDKRIPHGAGLGGGSSDAAVVLQAMNLLTNMRLPPEKLTQIAAGIGADVPFFLKEGCCYVGGKGEKVVKISTHISLMTSPLFVVLCSPSVHISTKEAYALWDRSETKTHSQPAALIQSLNGGQRDSLPNHLFNSFEAVLFPAHPAIRQANDVFASLSPTKPLLTGSGSNLFSLHGCRTEAEDVRGRLLTEGYPSQVCELRL